MCVASHAATASIAANEIEFAATRCQIGVTTPCSDDCASGSAGDWIAGASTQ